MGKPHGEGRNAALRLQVAGLFTVQLSILLAGVLLLSSPDAWALDPALDVSQYAHTAWKIRDGFFKGVITSMAQTTDGYLWLGTEFGLLRFDGVRATAWQPPGAERLPDTYVRSLVVTRDGTLWIGTLKGLASWRNDKLTVYPKFADMTVDALLEDQDGTIWAAGFAVPLGRLCAIRKDDTECYGADGSLGRWVEFLLQDSQRNIWVTTSTGLWRWRPGPPKLYPTAGPIFSGHQSLIEDVRGALLISTEIGIKQLLNGKIVAYALAGRGHEVKTSEVFRDRNGALWAGVRGGRGLAHAHHGNTDLFSVSNGLSGDNVFAFFEDREGNIWVSTRDGLDRFRDQTVVTHSVNEGLSSSAAGPVLADRDGGVWIGTARGLDRWISGQITPYSATGPKLNGHFLNALFQDSRGRVWAAMAYGQVGYLENKRFIPVSAVPAGVVRAIAEDRDGNIWIAIQDSGLIKLSPEGKPEATPWDKFGHKDFAIALAADPVQGGLWLGFYNGGVVYFSDGDVRARYTTADGLGAGFAGRFQLDRDDTVWVATQGGLSREKGGRVTTLTSKHGLPCDGVHWVIQDDDHALWLYMPCGLVRIARSELDTWTAAADENREPQQMVQVTAFDSSDGVRSQGAIGGYSPMVSRSTDGKLWFSTFDGVSVIDPRRIPFNELPPPVYIEWLTADRKTYEVASDANRHSGGPVRLPPLIRDLEIDYTALSLVAPEKMRFRYKLEGWDRDWQDPGTRRQAFYNNLPVRKYRFRVVACNNSGVWNEAGAFLDFSVAPAYYQTVWFRLSCVAAFLALLWGLYQLRLQQIAREFSMRLDERVSERTRIARELHDSLLQGVQGLMFRLQAVREFLPGRPSEAMKALDIALERGDKVIVEGRDTISDLRQSAVGDSDIAQALTALGEELAAQSENGSAPCVRVLVEGKQRELNPVLRDEIYRIAREALRNAFRHSEAQKIEAEITYSDSEFLLRVRDDGIGMAPVVANQGGRAGHWGLPGMRERAKSFGGKLEVWSEQGAGTEIELVVPAAVSYGESNARRKSWFLRKKN
jgi:signal transduction histidine kinase/ligand-binding sensor domain-containing protein